MRRLLLLALDLLPLSLGAAAPANFYRSVYPGYTGITPTTFAGSQSSVVWSDRQQKFVAVSSNGVLPNGNNVRTAISYDGINWVIGGTTTTSTLRSVCFSEEKNMFVALAATNAFPVRYSTNGISWTLAGSNIAGPDWTGICWSAQDAQFVAVANSITTTGIATSPDGINWTLRDTPLVAVTTTLISVVYSPELDTYVAVGADATSGLNIFYSNDAVTWNVTTALETNLTFRKVLWVKERKIFVAFANAGTNRIRTSTDGITWSTITVNDAAWLDAIWVPELRCFYGTNASTATGSLRIQVLAEDLSASRYTTTGLGAEGIAWNWGGLAWSPTLRRVVFQAQTNLGQRQFAWAGEP